MTNSASCLVSSSLGIIWRFGASVNLPKKTTVGIWQAEGEGEWGCVGVTKAWTGGRSDKFCTSSSSTATVTVWGATSCAAAGTETPGHLVVRGGLWGGRGVGSVFPGSKRCEEEAEPSPA